MMIASVAVVFPGPSFAARTSAVRMPGSASPASTRRVSGPRTEPAVPAMARPIAAPVISATIVETTLTYKRVPRAEHELGDDVATRPIGPQQEAGRPGARQPVREVQLVRRIRGPHERQQGDGDERRHQRATEVQRDRQTAQAHPSGRRRRGDGVADVSRRERKCVDLNHAWRPCRGCEGRGSRRRCRPGSSGSG